MLQVRSGLPPPLLRTWLGNPAVVTVEECNSGGAKRVHLRVDTGPRKIIIDIVCHRPASSLPPAAGKCQVIVSMCSPSPSPPPFAAHTPAYTIFAHTSFSLPLESVHSEVCVIWESSCACWHGDAAFLVKCQGVTTPPCRVPYTVGCARQLHGCHVRMLGDAM